MSEHETYVPVMMADQVEEGQLYPIEVNGNALMLTKVDDQIYAVCGICTHEYAELWDGELEDDTIWCPLHASGFNVKTGEATNLPAVVPLATYDARVVDGLVHVARTSKNGQG